jgi:hypothetical protein
VTIARVKMGEVGGPWSRQLACFFKTQAGSLCHEKQAASLAKFRRRAAFAD